MEHTNMRKKSRYRSRRETGPLGYQKQKTAKEAPRTNSTELAQAFREATELHAAGRLVEAEKMSRQILNAQPTHCDSRHSLGVIYYQRGDHREAVRQIDDALKINSKNTTAHQTRGAAFHKLKRFDEAVTRTYLKIV